MIARQWRFAPTLLLNPISRGRAAVVRLLLDRGVNVNAVQREPQTMKPEAVEVPERVRRKAISVGEAGLAWLAEVDGLVRDLATEWRLSIGRTLSGGTESLVVEARTA